EAIPLQESQQGAHEAPQPAARKRRVLGMTHADDLEAAQRAVVTERQPTLEHGAAVFELEQVHQTRIRLALGEGLREFCRAPERRGCASTQPLEFLHRALELGQYVEPPAQMRAAAADGITAGERAPEVDERQVGGVQTLSATRV